MNSFFVRSVWVVAPLLGTVALPGQTTISTALTASQSVAAGSLTVAPAGSIIRPGGGGGIALTISGTGTQVTNDGTIRHDGTARAIRANGTGLVIANSAGATIQAAADDAIQAGNSLAGTTISLQNAGTIRATGGQAIDWNDVTGANTITNQAGGQILAIGSDAVRPGVGGVINNAGSISATPVAEPSGGLPGLSGSDGVDAQSNSGVAVSNSGTISGRHGITGGAGGLATFGISITNNAGGLISAVNGSGVNIDGLFTTVTATVVNAAGATIRGGVAGGATAATGDGDGVDVDGVLTLTNGGDILGYGALGGGNNAEGVAAGGGTINNLAGGRIIGSTSLADAPNGDPSRAGNGILIDNSDGGAALAATTVTNAGLIQGVGGFAVRFIGAFDDAITNQAGGTLRGGGGGAVVQTGAGNDTVISSGAIVHDSGGAAVAVALEDGNDTLSFRGNAPTVTGRLDGGAGDDTLKFELSPGGAMTVAGRVANFETIRVIGGTTTFDGVTITGSALPALTVEDGATLALSGGFAGGAAITVQSGGVLAMVSGAIYTVSLDGLVANTLGGYEQILVASGGAVQLSGATLAVDLGFTPAAGEVFTLFDAVSGATIDGTFNGLGEGDTFTVGGATFALSYLGGAAGRSVTLTTVSAVPEPASVALWAAAVVGWLAFARRPVRARRGKHVPSH